MLQRPALLAVLALVFLASRGPAEEPTTIEASLKREIIGPHLALEQVRTFVESRIPPMPKVDSAETWQRQADQMRRDALEKVVLRGEAAKWLDAKLETVWLETLDGGPGYQIKKLRYEALPGLWIPALLYVPEKLTGRVPVMLAVNGHDGKGKQAPYKQIRCINLAKRGMLVLNLEWVGMGQLRTPGFAHARMNQLDLCGTSGVAPFYLAMKRGLDLLLAEPHADPARVAVSGLSGGGWQTIFISSLDTRVTLANPVAGYSSFVTRARNGSDLGDSEQTPSDLATVADYSHLTAMLAPRPALLTYNAQDNCCFKADHALPPLLEAAGPIYKLLDKAGHLHSHVNTDPGTHNFERDNREALYRVIHEHFFAGSADFDPREIASDSEVRTTEDLNVTLPDNNADFNRLALDLSRLLPRSRPETTTRDAAVEWQREARRKTARVVKASDYKVSAEEFASSQQEGRKVRHWRLRMGETWTVPAVEFEPANPKGTILLVTDAGRASATAEVERWLAAGQRVVAVDPFYFGESSIKERAWLWALMAATVGERPLGLQVSQLAAIARWLHANRGAGPVGLTAVGPRTSVAVIAAGLEPQAVANVELTGSPGSLKELLEESRTVDAAPEQFCFGLLAEFDVRELNALAAPRLVKFRNASPRAKTELESLASWYGLWDVKFSPTE